MQNIEITKDMFEKLDDAEKNNEFIALDSKTFLQDAIKRFKGNKLAVAGFVFLVIMILCAIFVPMFSQYTYDGQDLSARNLAPSLEHLLGTDKLGRDIFVRIMYGARISLSIGFAAAFINLFIGIAYGGVAGYFGGKLDNIMMRIVDIIYSVPSLLYTILILMIFGPNATSMLIAISVTSWVGMARQVRTQIMSLKEQEFALAAKVIGCSKKRIIFNHLIINALGPIIVSLTMMVPSAIFTEAFLSVVGIGIGEPEASWGLLASATRELIHTQPVQVIWPILAISLTILSLNFIGDGLGEALEPKR